MDLPVRSYSLADQVFNVLLTRISDEIYPAGSQLPTENELVSELNVSRSTIRTAILKLEDRKFIHRKPGIGTYVNENTAISNPLNEFIELTKLIEENGFEPGYIHISSEIKKPGKVIQNELLLEDGEEIIKIKKIFTANQDPIIFVINHIPYWLIKEKISRQKILTQDLTKELRYFFKVLCNQHVSHFISQVRADIFKNISPPEEMVSYQAHTPTLIIDQTGYNRENRPIICTREYHPGNWMKFNIIRRWD